MTIQLITHRLPIDYSLISLMSMMSSIIYVCFLFIQILLIAISKALFTSREGNPSARVTLAGGSKIVRVYKQNFTGRVTLPPGTT